MKKLLFLLFVVMLMCGCSERVEIKSLFGRTMGTSYSIKYVSVNGVDMKQVNRRVVEQLRLINQEMSTFLDNSELSSLNSNKSTDWIALSGNLHLVLKKAFEISKVTNGAFDVTIGPLVNLWGFGPTGRKKVPSQQEVAKAKSVSGYWNVMIDSEKPRMKKRVPGVYIDLSAIAKGHGVDRIADLLESIGINNYMVEIGGEIRSRGSKAGKPWRIAIESPDLKKGSYQRILEISHMAMATSGSYRNFFKENGKHYSHTIDLKTGMPVTNRLLSVTVLHETSCMISDAWATALMALGEEKGFKLAEQNGLTAYFVYAEDKHQLKDKSTSYFIKRFPKE